MTQALWAAMFAMTLDDPLEASRFWVIEWQAAFEAFALPTTFAVCSLVLQGFSREALSREFKIRGAPEVPWEIESDPRAPVRADGDREFAKRLFPTNLGAGTRMTGPALGENSNATA